MTRIGRRLLGYVLAALIIVPAARGEAATLKAIAIQGEASPVGAAVYTKFAKRGPAIGANAGERVVFEGLAKSPKVKGIFAHDPDDDGSLVAQKGAAAPDSLVFKTFQKRFLNPAIDSTGTIALAAKLKQGFGEAVYVRKAGGTSLSTVARTGDVATGLASGFLKRFQYSEPIGLVATTAVAFIAVISDMPNVGGVDVDQVVYACAGGDLDCHAGSGTLTPMVALQDAVDDRPGQEICKISHLAGSEYGVAFRADISSDCLTVPAVQGVFRMAFGVPAGSVQTLALVGEPAEFPMSSYTQFRRAIDINNDGAVAFRARTNSTLSLGVKTTQFICDPATCPAAPAEAAVSVGDLLPGGNAIKAMESGRTVISDAGDLAFFARSKGPSAGKKGIYIRRANSTIDVVAEKGDTAPMLNPMDPAATFSAFASAVAISDDGRVAFRAKIKRDTGPKKSRQGIFVFE